MEEAEREEEERLLEVVDVLGWEVDIVEGGWVGGVRWFDDFLREGRRGGTDQCVR